MIQQVTRMPDVAPNNEQDVTPVVLYHDESTKPFLAHGCFVVPITARGALLAALAQARGTWGCDTKLHFSEFSGTRWNATVNCAKNWLGLGVEAMRSKRAPALFAGPLRCKLGIILFDATSRVSLDQFGGDSAERYIRWNETLIRILIKGALRYCFSSGEKIRIENVFTDGQPYRRPLSEFRILQRLEQEHPDISIAPGASITHLHSDHRDERCVSVEDAHLLQLVDLMLGATVGHASGSHPIGSKKELLSRPISDLIGKSSRGKGFERSGHFRSFAISKASISKGEWQFERISSKSLGQVRGQLGLF